MLDLTLIRPNTDHEYVIEHKHVAEGYGTSPSTIHNAKREHADELIEGTHYFKLDEPGRGWVTFWTKRGVIRLGMFLRSDRAVEFRQWAENLVMDTLGGVSSDIELSPVEPATALGLPDPDDAIDLIVSQIDQAKAEWTRAVKDGVAARLGKSQNLLSQVALEFGVKL